MSALPRGFPGHLLTRLETFSSPDFLFLQVKPAKTTPTRRAIPPGVGRLCFLAAAHQTSAEELSLTPPAGTLLSKATRSPEVEQRTDAVGALGSPFGY